MSNTKKVSYLNTYYFYCRTLLSVIITCHMWRQTGESYSKYNGRLIGILTTQKGVCGWPLELRRNYFYACLRAWMVIYPPLRMHVNDFGAIQAATHTLLILHSRSDKSIRIMVPLFGLLIRP